MVERSCSMNILGAETNDLRIAHYERKEVVQRLQEELDAEREAAATSAREALSMILRLQGEKAELAMEAGQYKRMVEERMYHAEISIALLEDLIYQKETEITALEFQVESYRFKLMNLGYNDLKLQENQDHLSLTGGGNDDIKCCDRSQTPSPESVTDLTVEKGVIEQSLDSKRDQEKKDLDVYLKQIKNLDEQVKDLTDFRDSIQDQYKSLKLDTFPESELNNGEKSEEDFASSSNFKDDFCKIETLVKKVSKQKRLEKKSSKQIRDKSGKRDRTRTSTSFSTNDADYLAELQRLRQRLEQLERGRTYLEPEISEDKQEQTSLLRQTEDEPSSEMRIKSTENLQAWLDPAIVTVQEAMLHFWL